MLGWAWMLVSRIRGWLSWRPADEDFARELESHLELLTQENVRRGMPLEKARRAARVRLGGVPQIRERHREMHTLPLLETVVQDIRYGVRTLRKSPGFTAVAVLTLALAIGANTAIFTIVNGLMLRALPVAAPEQLALVSTWSAVNDGFPGGWNMVMWEQIRQRAPSLGRALAWTVLPQRLDLATEGEADPVDGIFVSGNFFQELGVVPVLGRTFTNTEDNLGRIESRVGLISHGLWQRRFGGDADIVGRSMLVNRVPITIVGVAPPAFLGPEVGRAFDIALPIGSAPLILHDANWGGLTGRSYLAVMLRLAPGQSLESANAALRGMQRQMIQATLPPNGIWGENQDSQLKDPFVLVPAGAGISELRRQYSRAVLTILVIAALVLLIACANIASLMVARGAA